MVSRSENTAYFILSLRDFGGVFYTPFSAFVATLKKICFIFNAEEKNNINLDYSNCIFYPVN